MATTSRTLLKRGIVTTKLSSIYTNKIKFFTHSYIVYVNNEYVILPCEDWLGCGDQADFVNPGSEM